MRAPGRGWSSRGTTCCTGSTRTTPPCCDGSPIRRGCCSSLATRHSGATIAVLGTGPDIAYPRSNAQRHARIAEHGVLVSEYPPGTVARPGQFPRRNRIIAGLALGILVVEAAQRSGSLITARLAAESGREVFAIPGSIHNPKSRGCHRLLRDGVALVESAQEVVAALGPLAARLADDLRGRLDAPINPDRAVQGGAALASGSADPDYKRLWAALGHDPTGMDGLVSRTGLTAAQLSSMLLVMELEGQVVSRHGRYTRTSTAPAAVQAEGK